MSAKSIDKSIGKSIAVTFCERIGIGIVDTFDKKYQYLYRRYYLKVSLTTLFVCLLANQHSAFKGKHAIFGFLFPQVVQKVLVR